MAGSSKHYFHVAQNGLYEWLQSIVASIPGAIGDRLRGYFYSSVLRQAGAGFRIGVGCHIKSPQAITIGNDTAINDYCWMAANSHVDGGIKIGSHVLIGPYVILHTGNHRFDTIDQPV